MTMTTTRTWRIVKALLTGHYTYTLKMLFYMRITNDYDYNTYPENSKGTSNRYTYTLKTLFQMRSTNDHDHNTYLKSVQTKAQVFQSPTTLDAEVLKKTFLILLVPTISTKIIRYLNNINASSLSTQKTKFISILSESYSLCNQPYAVTLDLAVTFIKLNLVVFLKEPQDYQTRSALMEYYIIKL